MKRFLRPFLISEMQKMDLREPRSGSQRLETSEKQAQEQVSMLSEMMPFVAPIQSMPSISNADFISASEEFHTHVTAWFFIAMYMRYFLVHTNKPNGCFFKNQYPSFYVCLLFMCVWTFCYFCEYLRF